MPAEVLIQIVCKNDETRVFFSQILFVFRKEILKYLFLVNKYDLLNLEIITECVCKFPYYSAVKRGVHSKGLSFRPGRSLKKYKVGIS